MTSIPSFKYHRDPVSSGSFVKESVGCESCGLDRGWRYDGPSYSVQKPVLCPWCLADGSAAKRFDVSFQDDATIERVTSESATDELLHRTPGYNSLQSAYWLSHCDDYMVYLGVGKWSEVERWWDQIVQDLGGPEDINKAEQKALIEQGDYQLHLFECLKCQTHRVHADMP